MQILVNLTYDQDYKGYVADVPELPGCMSQGKTVEAALKTSKRQSRFIIEALPPKKRRVVRPAITTTVEV